MRKRVSAWSSEQSRLLVGSYEVKYNMVHVTTALGEKATQVGGSDPYAIARLLLQELGREGKA